MKTLSPALVFAFLLSPSFLPAATKTWDGGGLNTNWSDAANWNADGAPTSSDAVVLDNSVANPVPQINAQSGANCGTLAVDGAVSGTFLNYGGATPLVTNLFGASVNAATTGPLISITANAPASVTANKVNFQLRTNGALFVATGKTFTLSNSFISQNGTRTLTKTGAGTVQFSGSGSLVSFTGGLNMAEGVWNAGTDTEDLPVAGVITFTNPPGTSATITSTNSHSIGGLAGGNSSSEFYATGASGLTITGSAVTTFSGRLRGASKLNYSGTGRLTLNGDNTFTGAATVNSGTLALGATGTIASSPSVTLATGASFDVSALASGFTLGGGKTLSGSGTVVGSLTAATTSTVSPGVGDVGTLTVSNGFTLAAGATLALELNGAASHDALVVSGGTVSLAGNLVATLGFAPAIGDTFYLVRNTGAGSTTGTLSGVGDGGKLDLGGKWFRMSFTSDFGGSGFAVGGSGNDVALQRMDDPSPSGPALAVVGPANGAVLSLQFSWLDNATSETGYRVYRVLADGALQLVATLPANSASFTETASNYQAHTYAVQAFNASGTLGDLTFSAPFQAGTSFALRQAAMLDDLSTEVPNLGQFGGGPHRIGRTGFWCATGRLLRGDTATGISYITTSVEDANAEGPNAGFSMWPGMDAYLRWNHLFPQSLKDRYQQIYVGADAYNNGSTPNQRFMLATASYLANGVWGPTVNSVASASNGIGGASGKDFILHILNKTPFNNHEEHNASHYLQYTLAPIETLAEFAQDAEVRNKARLVMNWSLAEAAGYLQNGRWCVSATRGRAADLQNNYDITGFTWQLLFGGPTPSSYFDSFATAPFLTPQFPAVTEEILAAAQERTQSYTRRSLAQRYLSGGDVAYFKQCWMTPSYALWSQVEGDVTYNADGSLNLLDVNTAGIQDGYQGNRWGIAWDSPPGNDSMISITTPTTYSGSTSGISVWEDTLQHKGTVIAVYNMPVGGGGSTGNNGNWANEYIKGDIPNGYLAYIDQSDALGRIFLHYDSVLVSIQLTDTFSNYSGSPGFQYTCNKQGVIVETAAPSEYPQATAAERLAAFRSDILAKTVTDKTGINAAAPKLIYTNRGGDVLELTFGLPGKINGITVDYQSWPLLEDPWMSQSQRGHLHLFGPNRTVTQNFHSWTETVNHRPAVSISPAYSAAAGVPLEIDLSTLVSDLETPDLQLVFGVTTPVNGTVSLLADGKTARITPALGNSAPVTFQFSARDRGPHPDLVLHYDFETSATLDASGQSRDATQTLVGAGSAVLESDVPSALGANSSQSLRLNEASPNAVKLSRLVPRSTLEMSNGSWTFATWFKRASRTTDDFLFYIGAGDGFSGNGDELQLRCAANADTLRLEHYNASNAGDLSLVSPGTALSNAWHHAAITFEKTADNSGTVRLFLNGVPVGVPTSITWSLRQDLSLVIGGIASTVAGTAPRYFNGWVDDAALFRRALSPSEIASLSTQSVATFGGLAVSSSLTVTVPNPVSVWTSPTSGNWSAAANWLNSNAPTASSADTSLRFFTGVTLPAVTVTATNDLPGTVQANSLVLDGTGAVGSSLSLAGGPVALVTGGNSAPPVISLLAGPAGFSQSVANNLTLAVPTSVAATGPASFIFSGVLSGAGGFTQTGPGTLQLTGANTLTGPVTVTSGILHLGAASGASTSGSLAAVSSLANNGQLVLRRTDVADLDLTGPLAGTGSISFLGSGVSNQSRYTLNNPSTGSGGATLSLCRVNLSNATGLGTGPVTVNTGAGLFVNAAITVANPFTISGNGWTESAGQLGALRLTSGVVLSGPVTLAASSRVAASGTGTLSGPLSGNFGLEIGEDTATGKIILAGAASHTGNTTVSFGTLELASTGSLRLAPAANGVSNRITGAGTLILKGAMVLDLANAAVAHGNSWTLVDVSSLLETFDPAFNIPGFTENANVWTKVEGTNTWTFSEATGVLALTVAPVLSPLEQWRQANLGTSANSGNAADLADPDNDGISNLVEYALGLNPNTTNTLPVTTETIGASLDFTYTRSKTALLNGITFQVESADTLGGTWTTPAVSPETILNDNGTTQTVKVTVPLLNGQRFLRLAVTAP